MTGFLNVLFVETPAIPAAEEISSPPANNRRLDTLADAAAIAPIASAGIFMVDTNDVVSRSCFLLVFLLLAIVTEFLLFFINLFLYV